MLLLGGGSPFVDEEIGRCGKDGVIILLCFSCSDRLGCDDAFVRLLVNGRAAAG